jgi:hypothetical protein
MTTGLTLQEEAWNTERHHSFWASDQKLRHSKIEFVSAGPINPSLPRSKDAESALAKMTLDSPHEENMEIQVEMEEGAERQGHQTQSTHALPDYSQLFFIDAVGDKPPSTGLPTPKPRFRSISPTPSNSSEEVIVFQGRNKQTDGTARATKPPRILADPIDSMPAAGNVSERLHGATTISGPASWTLPKDPSGSSPAEFDAVLSAPKSRRYGRRGRQGLYNIEHEEEDALITDYIANMDAGVDSQDWDRYSRFQQRPLGGSGDDAGPEDTESPTDKPGQSKPCLHSGWDRTDICDFDDLSTSDEVVGEVQAILSKRSRSAGVQYLVVCGGQSVDEARWVPATTLTSAEALLRINEFEEAEKLVAEYQDNEEGDSTDSEDMDTDDAVDEDVDQGQWQKKVGHLPDEQIPRLLAKQEELGMGSNELLLLDDAADADEDDDFPHTTNKFNPFLFSSPESRPKDHSNKRPRGDFPAASALADAYDGFDVIDFERPSLKKKSKGRKGKLPFDLSDSDLEATLQASYKNDWANKKVRKQQREALRAEGLLGSKNGKPNLKDKYREGMGFAAVRDEIRAFLLSNNTT